MIGATSDRKSQRIFRAVRLAFLVLFLAVSTVFGILHVFLPGTKPVSVDALDPFGGIETAITLALSGSLLAKLAWSSVILLAAVVITALVFRRVFCGEICAFGALQELFGRLGRRLFRKRFIVPKAVDKPARLLKYLILAAIVALSAITGTLVIRPYDPWAAYHHIFSTELITGFLVGLLVLILSLVGSLFYDRFFCKYLCPMGGFLGLINRIGWFRVKRVEATCTHCMACDKACPMNVKVESVEQVQSAECITCGLCVNACPVKDTLVIEGPRKGRISSGAVLGITIAIFAAVVGTATALGSFKWTQSPLSETPGLGVQAPAQGQGGAKDGADTGAQAQAPGQAGVGEAQGAAVSFNPDDIKGSDTFAAVSAVTGIPKEELVQRFNLAPGDFEKPIKDAAHREGSGFDTTDVREFVKEKLGK